MAILHIQFIKIVCNNKAMHIACYLQEEKGRLLNALRQTAGQNAMEQLCEILPFMCAAESYVRHIKFS